MSEGIVRGVARRAGWAMMGVLLLGVWLAGCSQGSSVNIIVSTPPVLPTVTPLKVTNGQVTYTSIDQLYQLDYPAAWQSNPLISTEGIPNARDFSAPDGSAHFTVLPLQGTQPAQVGSFITSFLHDDGATSTTIGAAGATVKVGANTWTTLPFTFAMPGNANTGMAYLTTHSTYTVVILTYAPNAAYAGITKRVLQPMLVGFTFLH